MKSRLALFWAAVRDSLWFVPAISTTAMSLFAIALLAGERQGWIDASSTALFFGGDAESARALLSAIASGLVTVTGVAFSVTIVALELSSSQYTPRVLPSFMADRANQLVIGILIGTFTYSLLVLRVINSGSPGIAEFIPRIAITIGMLLGLVSVATIIFFINHAARFIQISWILKKAVARAIGQVERLFPEDFGVEDQEISPNEEPPAGHAVVCAQRSGYVQAIDEDDVFNVGRSTETMIRLEHRIGAFVLEGQPLARVWPSNAMDEPSRRRLTRAFTLGTERTADQDYELTLIEIADIAVKALSPGINDPTTAQSCIDRLSQLLLILAKRHAPRRIRTKEGRAHVIVRVLPFERAVESAFAQVLHFGSDNPAIRDHLLERLDSLLELVPQQRRAPLEQFRAAVRERSTKESSPINLPRE